AVNKHAIATHSTIRTPVYLTHEQKRRYVLFPILFLWGADASSNQPSDCLTDFTVRKQRRPHGRVAHRTTLNDLFSFGTARYTAIVLCDPAKGYISGMLLVQRPATSHQDE
ncbi:MAG: hypothetical protein AAFR67_18345, partial [Chloroflexota bacterium]